MNDGATYIFLLGFGWSLGVTYNKYTNLQQTTTQTRYPSDTSDFERIDSTTR